MTKEPIDKYFGVPMSEWIERIPNELEVDGVGMWQIVPVGRDSFGLEGEELVKFTRRCVIALLQRGGMPVIGGPQGRRLSNANSSERNVENIAEFVISNWKLTGIDPDVDGIWFVKRISGPLQ